MSESPEQPEQDDPEVTPVFAVRADGVPTLPRRQSPPPEPEPDLPQTPAAPMVNAAVVETGREFIAAKWYTVSFLIFTGLFSVAGLVAMIWITVKLLSAAMN